MARTVKTLHVLPDGTARLAQVENSLGGLQALVEGDAQAVPCGTQAVAFINEEGKIEGLAANPGADRLLVELGTPLYPGDYLVGPVAIVGIFDPEGRADGGNYDVPQPVIDAARRVGLDVTEHL